MNCIRLTQKHEWLYQCSRQGGVNDHLAEKTSMSKEVVYVMRREYEKALPCRNEEMDGRLSRKDERSARAERDGRHFVDDAVKTIVDEMARAVDTSMRRRWPA